MCNSALLADGVVSTIVQMSPLSQLSARSERLLRSRVAKPVSLRTDTFVDSERPRLRPLQVTWQLTRVSSWKTASARSVKSLPRDTNRFSTAEAFHLIEEVATMRVPVLALTGGDPLTRPDLFRIIE